jgi:hypothetical protein
MMIVSSLGEGGQEFTFKREDLSFIVRYQWKSPCHLKEAIKLLINSRHQQEQRQTEPTPQILDASEFRQIRLIIASNPNTPPAVLVYLAAYGPQDADILERIAENPRTPYCVLEKLARCEHASVRASVAENINATRDILALLAADPEADVRYRLAENPHLPNDFLSALADDSNPYVRHRASLTMLRAKGGQVLQGSFSASAHAATQEDAEEAAQ